MRCALLVVHQVIKTGGGDAVALALCLLASNDSKAPDLFKKKYKTDKYLKILRPYPVVPVFGDSSGAQGAGFGAICNGRALWHGFTPSERSWSIQAKELATFVAAAERWGAEWTGRLVLIYTDNLGNALGINSAKALAGPALALLRRLYELADLHGFSLLALWLPRSRNVQADGISKQTNLVAARRSAVATGAVLREEDLEEV